jgi:phosphoglycolate phosphatase-like HAD superfamily hydrolase
VTRTKPDPDVFVLALERAGVPPESAVAVGDSVWDVRSAVGAGVRVASVLTGGAFCRSELEEAGAFAVYEDCAELLEEGFPEGVFPKEQAVGRTR